MPTPQRLQHQAANARLLPGINESSGSAPYSHQSVLKAYRDGIAVGDGATMVDGMASAFGVFCFPFSLYMLLITIQTFSYFPAIGIIGLLLSVPSVYATLGMLLFDFAGYKYEPALFDRRARKVHVFGMSRNLLKPWQWFFGKPTILTFDWDCLRAQVVETYTSGGAIARGATYSLMLVQTDRPGGTEVVGSFGVGNPSFYDGGALQVALWEHLRCFMEHDGPHVSPGDTLFQDTAHQSFWAALTFAQPGLGPGSLDTWRGKNGIFMIIAALGMPVFLPFTLIMGAVRWLAYRAKREPAFPAEVMASIGPEWAGTRLR